MDKVVKHCALEVICIWWDSLGVKWNGHRLGLNFVMPRKLEECQYVWDYNGEPRLQSMNSVITDHLFELSDCPCDPRRREERNRQNVAVI